MSVSLDALHVLGVAYLIETKQLPASYLETVAEAIEAKWGSSSCSGKAVEVVQEFLQYLKSTTPAVDGSKELLESKEHADDQQALIELLKQDKARLDFLEHETVVSLSFDFVSKYEEDGLVVERGFRLIRLHRLGDRKPSLREALDDAMRR